MYETAGFTSKRTSYEDTKRLIAQLALVIAALVPFCTSEAFAQRATIRGFVTDGSDGEPLPGVNVVLIAEDGTLEGTATNSDGFYAVSRIDPGVYVLRATFVGYRPHADSLELTAGQILTINFELSEAEAELGELVVESERETVGAANLEAGLQTVRASDVELVPAPDVSADLVNYLTTLPGVVSQGDRGGQLFIRGGEPTQNLILLDGVPIYQPFHIVGFFSAFPSEIITSVDVYAGGFGVRYGGRLSSVIDVAARDGNKRHFAGAVTAAPFVSSARIEGPIVPGRVSVLASVRESVIEHGASKLIDEELPFRFGDRFAKIHANVSSSARLSVTGISTSDVGVLGPNPAMTDEAPADERDEVRWTNEAAGLRFVVLPSTLPVFSEILVSYSRLENEFGPRGDALRSTSLERFGVTTNVTHYLGPLDFHWGLFLNSSTLDSNLGGQYQNVELQREFVTEAGFFVEPEVRTNVGLVIRPGVRLHSFPSKSRTFLEPRVRATWSRGLHRISAAAGIYHQEIVGLNDRRDAGDVFTAWTSSPLGIVPEAYHAILGYRVFPFRGLALSLEGFYKHLKDVIVPEWTAFPRFTTRAQEADGSIKGLDARIEWVANAFYAAITYGLSQVRYTAAFPALQILTGDHTTAFSPPHDRRHQVNAIASTNTWGFDVSVRWQLSSGVPFNESLGFDRFILMDSLIDVRGEPGDERVLYGSPYTGRLPLYHRLDVSVDREFEIKDRAALTVQVGLINAYDRRNLFYLDLFTLRRVDQLPVIPTVGLKLEIR